MKKKSIAIHYLEYSDINELNEDERQLLGKARDAANKAYAVYSHLYIGAAVQLYNGAIIAANNQENAAFPSGLCAERVALFYAGANYRGTGLKALAVSAADRKNAAVPCGACLQVLSEYEDLAGSPVKIIVDGDVIFVFEGINQLLPFRFRKDIFGGL